MYCQRFLSEFYRIGHAFSDICRLLSFSVMINDTEAAVAIIACTHRPGSRTRMVAGYYQSLLAAAQVKTDLIDFQDLPHDFLFTDLFGKRSEAFGLIEERMKSALKWVMVLPEYNGSFPGILKLFIDALLPATFRKKRVGLVGVSAGNFGNVRGLDQLTGILNYLQAVVLPFKAHLMLIDQKISPAGELTDEAARTELNRHIEALLAF
jgi:NAD(P)H-dependent FMN reductase